MQHREALFSSLQHAPKGNYPGQRSSSNSPFGGSKLHHALALLPQPIGIRRINPQRIHSACSSIHDSLKTCLPPGITCSPRLCSHVPLTALFGLRRNKAIHSGCSALRDALIERSSQLQRNHERGFKLARASYSKPMAPCRVRSWSRRHDGPSRFR